MLRSTLPTAAAALAVAFAPDLSNLGERSNVRHAVESMLAPNTVVTEGFRPIHRAGFAAYLLAAQLQPRPSRQPDSAGHGGFAASIEDRQLTVTHGSKAIATFVFRDDRILRPYLANLHAPDGTKVSRNHPPLPGVDATDHDTMHPGVWMGFGELQGADFWRNKGRMEHIRFVEPLAVRADGVAWASECHLLAADGARLGSVVHRVSIAAIPDAWLLVWDATFQPEATNLTFGDQEEMGFGARVSSSITEKAGGRIVASSGLQTAKGTWGQPADWCDYSGSNNGQPVGIMLMASPSNFRPSWWHNRDYGVFVANPFGRESMKQGARSAVTVRKGETLRLRFGAALHSGPNFKPSSAWDAFQKSDP